MSAAVLQFPSVIGQMKALRDQHRNMGDLAGEDDSLGIPSVEDELAKRRQRYCAEATELMKILAPVLWQWSGASLSLSFAAKPEAITSLSSDTEHATKLFLSLQAVATTKHWWTIESVDGIEFDNQANLVIVSLTVAEYLSRKLEKDDPKDWQSVTPPDDRFDYFQPGVNDADFHWRYVFKKQG